MSANPEDQKLARAVVLRLCPLAVHMSDAQLDADPICQWVACLFREVRDEVKGQRSAEVQRWMTCASCGCSTERSLPGGTPCCDSTTCFNRLSRERAFPSVIGAATARPSAWACEVANKFYVETYDSLSSAQTVHALAALLDEVMSKGGTTMRATGEKPDPVGPLGMAGERSDDTDSNEGGAARSRGRAPGSTSKDKASLEEIAAILRTASWYRRGDGRWDFPLTSLSYDQMNRLHVLLFGGAGAEEIGT